MGQELTRTEKVLILEKCIMNNAQLAKCIEMLGMTKVEMGIAIGLSTTATQCRQLDKYLSGQLPIKKPMFLAIECIVRRRGKLSEFRDILNT